MTAYWCAAPAPLTLTGALAAAGRPAGAVAFLSSAGAHLAARWDGTALRIADGECELTGVFSARVIDEVTDLRWLHTGGGLGTAVAVTETPDEHPGWTVTDIPVASTVDGQYALWGRRFDPLATGWCRAVEGRLKWVDLPLDPPETADNGTGYPSRYVCMRYREYLTLDEYGNAGVTEERLLGLALAEPTHGNEN